MLRLLGRRQGLTTKLVVPFVVIFVTSLAIVTVLFARSARRAVVEGLQTRAEMLATPLTAAMAESVGAMDVVKVSAILAETRKADPDIAYAVVVDPQGKGFAATDEAMVGKSLVNSEFDKALFKTAKLLVSPVPGTPNLFEVAMPVNYSALGRVGVLRIAFSTARAATLAWQTAFTTALAGVVALALGVVLYIFAARRIIRPLHEAARGLADLASGEGDLTRRLDVGTGGEIGELASCFNTFVDKLSGIIGNVRGTASHVTGASHQLSGAASQLASGTQQQAASLEETAASLEQITATVKQNAENARQASQLANGSRDAADRGGQVVSAAMASMQEITRSSKRIADILSVIDEIAFQTNLLALNAAVEAARAGEQGRGFAVVASEVRNLAQRSAGAAKEIKALIQDSVAKVEEGSDLVNRSGKTLEEIVQSAKRVADIVAEIAAACQEQSGGIDQVNRAVVQMDRLTQDNAAQTEELSSTSQVLADQAGEMLALVGRFTLAETEGAPGDMALAPFAPPAAGPAPETDRHPERRRMRATDPRPADLVAMLNAQSGPGGTAEEF